MYILKSFDRYYVRFNEDGGWDETYNPSVATVFKTKESASQKAETHTTMSEYMVPVDYDREESEFEVWVEEGMIRRSFGPLSTLNRKYNGESADEVLQWWLELQKQDEDSVQYEVYRTWPKLYAVFNHLWDTQSYIDRETCERSHSVSVYTARNGNYGSFREEVEKVLNYVTLTDENGGKILDVFDHYLSENGNSVSLVIQQDGLWRVEGRASFGPDDPEKVFNFLRKNRWYE